MRIAFVMLCTALLTMNAFAQDASNSIRFKSPETIVDTVNGVSIATARKDSTDFAAWYLNDTVKVAGVVTTPNMETYYNETSYCIQDNSGGIYVYYSKTPAINFSIGDSVWVIGQIQQYYGLTELVPLDTNHIKLISHNAVVPKPVHLTIDQFANPNIVETYESMLVEVDTLYRSSGYWPSKAGSYSSIYLKDTTKHPTVNLIQNTGMLPLQNYPSTDSIQMYINRSTNVPASGDSLRAYPINVVGVVSQYSSSKTVYSNGYEIIPRDTNDVFSTRLAPELTIAQARVENNWVPTYSTNGDTIAVFGVVISPNIGGYYSSYFIQDTSGGVDVYSPTLLNFKVGDSVFVVGTVDQYNGLEEIMPLVGDSLHFGLLKHNAVLPKPKLLSLHDFVRIRGLAESYEGQLIQLDTLYKASGTWPGSGSGASIYVTNSSKADTAQLYVNKNTNVAGSKEHSYPINLIGVVSQYGTDSTGYEIIPPDTSDITSLSTAPGVPTLASPLGGVTGEPRLTTFSWLPAASATKYHLQVGTDNTFSSIVADTMVVDTTVRISDTLTANMSYSWHVSAVNAAGASPYTDPAQFKTGSGVLGVDESSNIPKVYALFQNYPNPFNPSTTISYDLPKNSFVKVTIYDVLGREVAALVNDFQQASHQVVQWNPSALSSGVYFCRIQAHSQDGSSNFTSVKKLLYMK